MSRPCWRLKLTSGCHLRAPSLTRVAKRTSLEFLSVLQTSLFVLRALADRNILCDDGGMTRQCASTRGILKTIPDVSIGLIDEAQTSCVSRLSRVRVNVGSIARPGNEEGAWIHLHSTSDIRSTYRRTLLAHSTAPMIIRSDPSTEPSERHGTAAGFQAESGYFFGRGR